MTITEFAIIGYPQYESSFPVWTKFATATATERVLAEMMAEASKLAPIEQWLNDKGYADVEVDDISYSLSVTEIEVEE